MDGKFIIMKKWKSRIRYDKDLLVTIPMWVKFPRLNFSHWDITSISKMASTIGRPIMMDEPTKQRKRLAYASVLIVIEAKHVLKTKQK